MLYTCSRNINPNTCQQVACLLPTKQSAKSDLNKSSVVGMLQLGGTAIHRPSPVSVDVPSHVTAETRWGSKARRRAAEPPWNESS